MNEAEALNVALGLEKYLAGPLSREEAPFDYSFFLRLHREMFGDVWGWAGRLRRSVTNIGSEPHLIEQRLYELSLNLPYWEGDPLLTQAARLHHQAVLIHPFENGNGRWSRTLANIWLHLHRHPLTHWPAGLNEESPVRAVYIEALKTADRGDEGPLLALPRRFTPE